MKHIKAFTMAEVLITLGIIGIVAAMTFPSLLGKYRRKVLETQFKKSVSVISQAIMQTKVKLGSDKFVGYCVQYESNEISDASGYVVAQDCYEAFFKNFVSIAGNKSGTSLRTYNIVRTDESLKTFNGLQTQGASSLAGLYDVIYLTNIMPDGSFLNMMINEYQFYIGVDINGQKGPNRLGHDIFIFTIDKNNDTISFANKPQNFTEEEIEDGEYEEEYLKERKGNPCSFTSKQKANGIGCAWYALRDMCPDGSGRSYFECLPD